MTQMNIEKACFSNLQKTQCWKGYPGLHCTKMIHKDLGIGFSLCCCIMTPIEKITDKDFHPVGEEETWLLKERSVGQREHSEIHWG